MRIALVVPPLTQLNTPYPATAYLARALRRHGLACTQRDLGIELVHRLFSRAGVRTTFDRMEALDDLPQEAWRALAMRRTHEQIADAMLTYLRGGDRTLARRILDTPLVPSGPRVDAAEVDAFGERSVEDAARHVATRWLSDMADLVTGTLDEGFGLARYQHHLAAGSATFDALLARLDQTTRVDEEIDALADTLDAEVVGLSVPFPGNLVAALRIGRRLRARGIHVVMGGGYVNTELREVEEPRLWDFVDTLCYDDGEGPLLAVLAHLRGEGDCRHRTRTREGWHASPDARDVPAESAAWYGDLDLTPYLQLVDGVNPAHRLWSDGRWNKITLAHGCYWKKCSFCDIHLDYVGRFAPTRAQVLADQVDELIAATGTRGFHFVDEAAPPRGLRDLALELLTRGTVATLWGNVRFERAFTPDLCRLLAAAGVVAVTGGLEVASDRLLARMRKGVTIEQVARAGKAFRDAGVLVHAYLMYGFPTQTLQETVDAAEVVRQMFREGVIASAFWHRFVLTRHAGMYPEAEAYGLRVVPDAPGRFARNDVDHEDPEGADHDTLDAPLVAMLAAWMRGEALERPVHAWFAPGTPPTTEPPDRVARAIAAPEAEESEDAQLVWIGGDALGEEGAIVLHHAGGKVRVAGTPAVCDWVYGVVEAARPGGTGLTRAQARSAFPGDAAGFARRWSRLRAAGLLCL